MNSIRVECTAGSAGFDWLRITRGSLTRLMGHRDNGEKRKRLENTIRFYPARSVYPRWFREREERKNNFLPAEIDDNYIHR